jgi:hypothetical protein
MARSGRDPRGPDRRSPASSRDDRTVTWLIWLVLLGHMLRSRRFYERAAFTAIVLGGLARLGREDQARTFARLTVWYERHVRLTAKPDSRPGA